MTWGSVERRAVPGGLAGGEQRAHARNTTIAGRLVGTFAVALVVLLAAPPTRGVAATRVAVSAPQAIAYLDEQRERNGIPGGLTEDAALSQGCHDYTNLYHGAPGQFPHEERPTQPGYTRLGAEAAEQSDLAGFFWSPSWTADSNPWWIPNFPPGRSVGTAKGVTVHSEVAPLHITSLFDPAVTTAWYGERDEKRGGGGACMGTSGTRTFSSPSFFSFPGDGATEVPTWNIPSEVPWTPQMALGIPQEQPTGTNFVLWPEDTDAVASSASLVGPANRPFPVSLVLPSTPTPANGDPQWTQKFVGELSGGASFAVPTKPLNPNASYTLIVNWVSPTSGATYKQTISFATDSLLMTGPPIPVRLGVTHNHLLRIRVGIGGIGRVAALTLRPCRLIPFQSECYGTRAVDYRRSVRLTSRAMTLAIPRLQRYGEVNVNLYISPFVVEDTRSSGDTDICWPKRCAG